MLRFSLFTVCCSLLLFTGCRTTSSLNLAPRSVSSLDVQEAALSHHSHIHSMFGKGRVTVETPEIAQSGSFILTLQKPDSVLINLQGPFGIKVGSALVTRTEFLFYNSFENQLITGSSTKENLNRILHVQLSFDDLLNLFAGGAFLESDLRTPDETLVEDGQTVFVFTSSKTSRRYWVDPTTLHIQKIQFLDQKGKLVLEQTFDHFEDINGFAVPFTICITQPKGRQMLRFSYSEIQVNAEKVPFTFTIPSNAERIHW
jgi:outer membrane lipoprotein-sorting protein